MFRVWGLGFRETKGSCLGFYIGILRPPRRLKVTYIGVFKAPLKRSKATLYSTTKPLNPKPQTLNPKPQTPNPKPQTLNPKPKKPAASPRSRHRHPGGLPRAASWAHSEGGPEMSAASWVGLLTLLRIYIYIYIYIYTYIYIYRVAYKPK